MGEYGPVKKHLSEASHIKAEAIKRVCHLFRCTIVLILLLDIDEVDSTGVSWQQRIESKLWIIYHCFITIHLQGFSVSSILTVYPDKVDFWSLQGDFDMKLDDYILQLL